MSNDSPVHSQVTGIRLKADGSSIEVTVQVVGFSAGIKAEISGWITQYNGVFIPFYDTRDIPAHAADSPVDLKVPVSSRKLVPGQDIRVITQVTEVWPTELNDVTAEQAQQGQQAQEGQQADDKAIWAVKAGW